MDKELIIYHGSQKIIERPTYGLGKSYNDYGLGFYCTKSNELAKEWACPIKNDGYSNKYVLHLDGMKVMNLTKGKFNILNWLAILLANRKFDITSPIGSNARNYILKNFMPDVTDVDVMVGYRADDSYFSFAEDFVNNTLSLRDLNMTMRLGELGEQVVLLSKRSFEQINFCGYETADYLTYYLKRANRDQNARDAYASQKKNLQQLMNDIYILDIIRENMNNEDPRLQSTLSE